MDILPRVIEGNLVFLAPERRDNVPFYWKWANDREVTRLTQGYGRAPSLEAMQASYDKSAVADDVRRFGIHLMSTGDLIGRCALKNLNLIVGRGEASILIGDEKHRGHGYGTEAMRLLCTVGFDMLELHTIFLTVLACNPAQSLRTTRWASGTPAVCARRVPATGSVSTSSTWTCCAGIWCQTPDQEPDTRTADSRYSSRTLRTMAAASMPS